MKKKLILSYPSVKCTTKKPWIHASVLQDKDTVYLICDYYKDKAHKYRMAIAPDGYIHYDYEKETWDKKSMWRSAWYSCINQAMDDDAIKVIKNFAKEHMSYAWSKYSEVWSLEGEIDRAADKRRKDRENNERELLFSKLKDITVGFKKSIDDYVARTDIIYYRRKGKYAEYHCCQCGEDYTRRIIPGETYEESLRPLEPVPKLYGIAECPNCHHRGSLLQAGHAKIEKDSFTAWMYQCADDGTLMIRAYGVSIQRSIYGAEDIRIREHTRIFLDKGKARIYNLHGGEWYKCNSVGYANKDKMEFDYNSDSTILQSNLKYIPEGLEDLLSNESGRRAYVDERIQALISYARCPQLETLYKIGLYQICKRIMWKEVSTKAIDKKANEAAAILRLCKEDYKYLIKNKHHNDDAMLEYIKRARIKGIPLKKYDMYIELCRNIHTADDVDYLLKFQNLEKLYNTINKYIPEYGSMATTLIEYRDYIRLRQRRGDDLANTVYLKPRNLRETYTELRAEEERNKDKNYIEQMSSKYGNIANVSVKIQKKYTYETDMYLIRPAADAAEIVMEGRMLHHCVGSDSQSYMKNYAEDKSYILVLRKKNEPNTPYITIEIRDKSIRQWYGIHDSKPDKNIIKPLLDKYVAWLKRKSKKLKEAADGASQPVLMPAAI